MNRDFLFRLSEVVAVVCSLLYTWLLAEGNMWCWWFAMLASMIFMILTLNVGLYGEWLLHLFYLGMAIYGIYRSDQWDEAGLTPSLHWQVHLLVILLAGAISIISGRALAALKGAKATYLDAFTTVYSLWATWLMVNFYPENWLYWIVIDGASVVLYYRRGLYISSGLFVVYTALALRGWILWMNI